jgi:hypothetical protein
MGCRGGGGALHSCRSPPWCIGAPGSGGWDRVLVTILNIRTVMRFILKRNDVEGGLQPAVIGCSIPWHPSCSSGSAGADACLLPPAAGSGHQRRRPPGRGETAASRARGTPSIPRPRNHPIDNRPKLRPIFLALPSSPPVMNSPVNDLRGASSSLGVSLHLPKGTAALLGLLVMAGGCLAALLHSASLRRVARIHRWW